MTAQVKALTTAVEEQRTVLARHEEQISGARGLSNAIDALSEQVRSMTRAMWTVAGGIVLSTVSFALTVLFVFGG
jgi:hypothetical protein